MYDVEVVTYATHSFGNYENLINNKHGIKITTLGWGKPWKGLMYKYIDLYDYIKDMPDNRIIVFLDGFDVWVRGDLNELMSIYNKKGYRLVYSYDRANIYVLSHVSDIFSENSFISKSFKRNLFPSSHPSGNNLNTGMYMGQVRYLRPVLKHIIDYAQERNEINADQRITNIVADKFDFIDIDTEERLFRNILNMNELEESNSIFVQYPGKPSVSRFSRAIRSYYKYFLPELTVIAVVVTLITILVLKRIRSKK